MGKVGKKFASAKKAFEDKHDVSLDEAVNLVKDNASAKFDETIDIAINLGVDPKHADQMVRGVCSLPHGNGKEVKVAVFAKGEKAEEAKKALAFKNSIVGINNRNLKTLKTDIKTTFDLVEILIDHPGPIVSESGIKSEKEVGEIVKKAKINNFLIGESLLKDLNKKTSLLKRILQIRP